MPTMEQQCLQILKDHVGAEKIVADITDWHYNKMPFTGFVFEALDGRFQYQTDFMGLVTTSFRFTLVTSESEADEYVIVSSEFTDWSDDPTIQEKFVELQTPRCEIGGTWSKKHSDRSFLAMFAWNAGDHCVVKNETME